MKINYYTIHKNKRAKSLKKKRKARYMNVMPALIMANAVKQVYMVHSQPMPNYGDYKLAKETLLASKSAKILGIGLDLVEKLAIENKKSAFQRFKIEGRYATHKAKRK